MLTLMAIQVIDQLVLVERYPIITMKIMANPKKMADKTSFLLMEIYTSMPNVPAAPIIIKMINGKVLSYVGKFPTSIKIVVTINAGKAIT